MAISDTLTQKGNPEDPKKFYDQATVMNRYEIVPYAGISRAASIENMLIYSAQDSDSNYYVYLLGNVNKVPVTYQDAIIYNGQTPITIAYEKSDLTEKSVEESITRAVEETTSSSFDVGANFSTMLRIGNADSFWGAEITAGANLNWGSEDAKTRSTSDTVTTVQTKVEGTKSTIESTIGNYGEPAGKYRYSLFATSDVYYVLITNKENTEIREHYVSVLARPLSYAWGIDYDPDEGGNFGKTDPGELLEIPQLDISSLKQPTHQVEGRYIPSKPIVETPIASHNGSTYTTPINITLTSATPGATIYYTTDGAEPTRMSLQYADKGIAIPLDSSQRTGTITIKAFAVKQGCRDSGIMSHKYTVTDPLVTSFTITRRSNTGPNTNKIIVDCEKFTEDYYVTPKFDIERLQREGYIYIGIRVRYHLLRHLSKDKGKTETTIIGGTGDWGYTHNIAPHWKHNEVPFEFFSKSRQITLDDFNANGQKIGLKWLAHQKTELGKTEVVIFVQKQE